MTFIGFGLISMSSYLFATYVEPRLEPGRKKAEEELKGKNKILFIIKVQNKKTNIKSFYKILHQFRV